MFRLPRAMYLPFPVLPENPHFKVLRHDISFLDSAQCQQQMEARDLLLFHIIPNSESYLPEAKIPEYFLFENIQDHSRHRKLDSFMMLSEHNPQRQPRRMRLSNSEFETGVPTFDTIQMGLGEFHTQGFFIPKEISTPSFGLGWIYGSEFK
jgi:hypothetical protein